MDHRFQRRGAAKRPNDAYLMSDQEEEEEAFTVEEAACVNDNATGATAAQPDKILVGRNVYKFFEGYGWYY